MANSLSRFITDRLLLPAIDSQVEKALSGRQPAAYGVSLAKAIGQPHDANYALLYAIYKLNVDVSACVHKWAGGVTGPGGPITTTDEQAEITPQLKNDIDEFTHWLKNPKPSKLFEVMLYEGVEHFGVTGDFFWYAPKGSDGKPVELWPMHPAPTKIVTTKGGEILYYVMRNPGDCNVPDAGAPSIPKERVSHPALGNTEVAYLAWQAQAIPDRPAVDSRHEVRCYGDDVEVEARCKGRLFCRPLACLTS